MAILAMANLLLVLFDYSYIPWRDIYLKSLPQLTLWYGENLKGIEPDRFTEGYLETVQALEDQVSLTGLRSPQTAAILTQLATLSQEMVEENPFEVANKSGTLERIKYRMRETVSINSSRQAFSTFWSVPYLSQAGWQNSIEFFNGEIRPLMATNYYRRIGFSGEPLDRFWWLDSWFVALFAVEFLARTFFLSRRYQGTSWLDAIIWRWYDLFLLLPFWRWLRIIPVAVRFNQAKLINLNPINRRIVHYFVAEIAVELTEMVVVRILDQLEENIEQGDVVQWLLNSQYRYVDINGVNEVEVISQRLIQVFVYQVLPQLQPDLEALLHHTITQVLHHSPAYTTLQHLPGMKDLSQQLTRQLVTDLSQTGYQAIKTSLEDEVGTDLTKQLISRLGSVFRAEIQQNGTIEEIQMLAAALVNEIKVNYIRRVESEDWESLKIRKKQLYGITEGIGRGLISE